MLHLDQNLSFVRVSHEDAVSVADLNVTADDVGSEVAPGYYETLGPLEQREGVAELSAHMDVREELR